MRTVHRLLLQASLAVLVFTAQPAAYAIVSTELKGFSGVTLVMDEAGCRDPLPVTIKAGSRDELVQIRVLARAMAWVQTNVDAACPNVGSIAVTGIVAGEKTYQAMAQRSDKWRLVESVSAPAPATSASATVVANNEPEAAREPATPTERSSAAAPAVPAAAPTATVARAIRQCDALAAHPDDPEAFAAGVPDAKLDAKTAIAACEGAIKAEPQTPRLHFQLGRAYLKADRFEDAIEQLIAAAEDGHGGALAHLGDFYLDGAPGIDADLGIAKGLYEKAAASGFQPAAKVLAEFEDKTEMFAQAEKEEQAAVSQTSAAPANYRWPDVISAITAGNFDSISQGEGWTRSYLYSLADNLNGICDTTIRKGPPIFSASQMRNMQNASKGALFPISTNEQLGVGLAMMQRAVPVLQRGANKFWSDPGKYLNAKKSDADPEQQLFEDSLNDTGAFLTANSCQGPAVDSFAKNLRAFVTDAGDFPEDRLIHLCINQHNDAMLCRCFAGTANATWVPRKYRKAFMRDDVPFIKIANALRDENSQLSYCFAR